MLSALTHDSPESGSSRCLQDFACTSIDLSAYEKRNQHFAVDAEIIVAGNAVIFVTAVTVACRVGVVLEEIDVPVDAFLRQPFFGAGKELLKDAFSGFVVGSEIADRVTLGRGVLGMAADIEIKTSSVAQKDIA